MQEKLDFFVGEWKSVSVNQSTGQESTGDSTIQWGIGGKWLEWKFSAQLEQGPLELATRLGSTQSRRSHHLVKECRLDPRRAWNSESGLIDAIRNWVSSSAVFVERISRAASTVRDYLCVARLFLSPHQDKGTRRWCMDRNGR